jgi:hypothetical protein
MNTHRFDDPARDEAPPSDVPEPRELERDVRSERHPESRSWFRYDAEHDPRLRACRADLEHEPLELERLDDPRAYEGRGEYSVRRRDASPGYPAWLPDVGGATHEWDRLPEWQPPSAFESDLREQYRESIGPDFRGIGPKDYRRSDESILEDVSERLKDAPDVDASSIECNVQNGEVRLGGAARDRDMKYRAEEIAAGVRGVTHVQNDLRVIDKRRVPRADERDAKQG